MIEKKDDSEQLRSWGVIPLGPSRLQVRQIVLWLGFIVWFITAVAATQMQAITALAFDVSFLVVLLVLSMGVRTIALTKMAGCFCGGGLFLGIFVLCMQPLIPLTQTNPFLGSCLIVPLVELGKLLPVIYFLWQGRNFSSWTLGATDVLLMGAASGAGFAFCEDAFAPKAIQSPEQFFLLLPHAEVINGHFSSGPAVWTALAAAAIGLPLLFGKHRLFWLYPLGLALAVLDHLALNCFQIPSSMLNVINFFTANGFLTLALFGLLLCACIVTDFFVQLKTLPKAREFSLQTSDKRTESLEALWDSVLDLRRLAYAHFRYISSANPEPRLAMTVALVSRRLINRYRAAEPVQVIVRGSIREAGIKLNLADLGKSVTVKGVHLKESDELVPASTAADKQVPALTASPKAPAPAFSTPTDLPMAQRMALPDRYELLEQIGAGGMGVIFRGRHRMTGADLAIKVLHPQYSTNQIHLRRFEQEARAATTLNHPNIVTVHDFGITSQSVAFLVMEWLDGPHLEAALAIEGRFNLQRFLHIFLQCASALAHSHQKGILHRDVKPSNIILLSSDRDTDFVKIVDFGIAKLLTDSDTLHLTQSGDILGSPMFMSPEQCQGEKLDHRSDIYSLGCVMFEAIVGRHMFDATNSAQVFYKHVYEMPLRPSVVQPNLERPDLIEPLLFKALQKDPTHRFASMEELESELKRIQAATAAVALDHLV